MESVEEEESRTWTPRGDMVFHVEGIVVSIMGCCLSQSIRTYMAVEV